MTGKTKIEWTEHSWNPIVGCSVVSPGCTNCYAMKFAGQRLDGNPQAAHYAGTTQESKAGPVWTGKIASAPDKTWLAPLRRKKPTTYFVNSMGDLFHESVPDEWIDRAFAIMALCPQHTFQVLTKRAERMRVIMRRMSKAVIGSQAALLREEEKAFGERIDIGENFPHLAEAIAHPSFMIRGWPLPNIWLGVSAEDQQRADERIPHLLETPAAVRFVSAEPLVGSIDFTHIDHGAAAPFHTDALKGYCSNGVDTRLDWIIAGGESGPGARPMHPDWARSVRDQCEDAGIPFFFKQWGEWLPGEFDATPPLINWQGVCEPHDANWLPDFNMNTTPGWDDGLAYVAEGDSHAIFRKIGKKAAGCSLDGREHNAMPDVLQ